MSSEHPSRLALDGYVAGTLGESYQPIADHVHACVRCREQVALLEKARGEFLARYPDLSSVPTRQRAELLAPRWHWPRFACAGGFALAAAVVLFAVLGPEPGPPGYRLKGSSLLELAIGRDGRSVPYDGQPLREGDRVALRYSTELSFLLLVSLEHSGRAAVLLDEAGQSLGVAPGTKVKLEQGIELDDYAGLELWIALFSAAPLESDVVLRAVEQAWAAAEPAARDELSLADLPLPADQVFVVIDKEAR
jgi:hypothetical protein